MKTTFKLIGVVACIAVIGLAFFGCKEGDGGGEKPLFREKTITLTFDNKSYTAKVQGTFLEADWTSVINKMQLVANGWATSANDSPTIKERLNIVLTNGFTIVIKNGSAAPEAINNKSMAIYIDYLLTTTVENIVNATGTIIMSDVYAQ